ncbi:hypothetical protein A6P55_10510 [Pandoraea pnomenusa]|jgi:hypothetical protein|nr:hypothetical protein [Pandoraea pnomenusa]ANC44560.1 hypothetical protein A6P55_10510 [Pandoraea pnomenusa]
MHAPPHRKCLRYCWTSIRRRSDFAVVHVHLDGQRVRTTRRIPVFVDIRLDTLNLDETLAEDAARGAMAS